MTYSLLLHTSRLTITGINEINVRQLQRYFVDNYEHLLGGGGQIPRSETQVRALLDHWLRNIAADNEVRFFILRDEQLIGVIGLTNIVRGGFQAAYLGYHLAEQVQGQGYMTEALQEVIAFAFDALNLHRIMANYRPANLASGRVLEKLGFVREGYAEKYLMVNGHWEDHILTALRNDRWRAPKS